MPRQLRVLCLHGLGGTGASMWPIVAELSRDHTVLAPTLPGHGSNPEDLLSFGWEDWLAAAREWPADVAIGQSLGGALALALAAEGACRAVVAINPVAPDPDAADGLEWRLGHGQKWVEDVPVFPGEAAYSRIPLRAVSEMTTGVLAIDYGAVVQPLLLVSSANDELVDPATADLIASAVSGPVQRLILLRGGHMATLDEDRLTLTTAIQSFLASH